MPNSGIVEYYVSRNNVDDNLFDMVFLNDNDWCLTTVSEDKLDETLNSVYLGYTKIQIFTHPCQDVIAINK